MGQESNLQPAVLEALHSIRVVLSMSSSCEFIGASVRKNALNTAPIVRFGSRLALTTSAYDHLYTSAIRQHDVGAPERVGQGVGPMAVGVDYRRDQVAAHAAAGGQGDG